MPTQFIENRTYDEIKVGDSATLTRTLRPEDIQLFAIMSGDVNPAHVDPEYAHSSMFHEVIAHGMWGGALISTVLGTEFPGPGTIYIGQTLRFSRPVKVGDTITVKVTCKQKFDHNKHMIFECLCTNQDGLKVIAGEAEVLAPTEKVKRERVELPEFTISDRWARYKKLLARAKGLPGATAVFAQPVHAESLQSAVTAAESGIMRPVLVGPEQEIREVAEQNSIDLVTLKMRTTLDAAALCKMADRGQITGAVVDGPLGIDNAISIVAARSAHLKSAVAGQADVLIAPDLEAGNMLAKQLEHLSDAISGGVVLGGKVPIVLANRNDSIESRVASLVLSLLVANYLRARQ